MQRAASHGTDAHAPSAEAKGGAEAFPVDGTPTQRLDPQVAVDQHEPIGVADDHHGHCCPSSAAEPRSAGTPSAVAADLSTND
jgi:hypothetical protein